MAGLLSKGIKFEFAEYSNGTLGSYQEAKNLQAIPSLGGEPEKVDVTCLEHSARQYINGIKDYGDLDFTFLYDNSSVTSNYRILKKVEGEKVGVKITLPDETTFVFDAELSIALNEAEVNQALTFNCSAALQSDISVTNPA